MSNFTFLGYLEMVDLWLETKQDNNKFHGLNGFLSLQLGLSFELGLRLRLTKKKFHLKPLCLVITL